MILAVKGKNTVQAVVIFRNFMDEGRSSVNQTNNDIKNAGGAERGREQCEGYVGRSRRRAYTLYAKRGEFVNTK